jgi:hypothetical protein
VNTPNFNLYPPSGYAFRDPGSGLTFTGGNWPEVIYSLRAYREANGLPEGKPEEEVFGQFCLDYPHYCESGRQARMFARLAVTQVGFASAMQAWIADIFSKVNTRKVGYVTRDEYARRAKICRTCPRQRSWSSGCAGCEKNTRAVVRHILGNRKPEDALDGCSLLREDTKVSCHLTLDPVTVPGMPSRCWRKEA